ncbi:MAG: acyl carrier protein [Alphaproteobacteria bacterium]
MNDDQIKSLIFAILGEIAPEADPATLRGGDDMREALDLDSMDFLNLVIALHQRTGHPIPEADYPRLVTLDGAIAYLRH